MKKISLALATLTALGAIVATAQAAGPSYPVAVHVAAPTAAHHGWAAHGSRYYAPYHPHRRPPVVVRPVAPWYPPAVYPPVVYPPPYDCGWYGPRVGVQYQGRGFGLSIGF